MCNLHCSSLVACGLMFILHRCQERVNSKYISLHYDCICLYFQQLRPIVCHYLVACSSLPSSFIMYWVINQAKFTLGGQALPLQFLHKKLHFFLLLQWNQNALHSIFFLVQSLKYAFFSLKKCYVWKPFHECAWTTYDMYPSFSWMYSSFVCHFFFRLYLESILLECTKSC